MNNIVSSLPIFPPFSKRFHPTLRKKKKKFRPTHF
jgi:hypothetical protein